MVFTDLKPPKEIPENSEILWRGDPAETFSDWTIEIITKRQEEKAMDDKASELGANADDAFIPELGKIPSESSIESITTYGVHKGIICCGKRMSGYFAKVFHAALSGNFEEGHTAVSSIELDPLLAETFPVFLDYLYTERPLQICTENATALCWLGDYFEVAHLRWESQNFIRQNVSVTNLDIYYRHSTRIHEESVLLAVQKFTNDHVLNIPVDHHIILSAGLNFWTDSLTSDCFKEVSESRSLHVCKIVDRLSKLHSEELNRETFDQLTEASVIPVVDSSIALSLCEFDDLLKTNEPKNDCDACACTVPDSLQARCADALAKNWRTFVNEGGQDNFEMLKSRQSTFLAKFLSQSLKDASKKESGLQRQLSQARKDASKKQSEFQQQLSEARRDAIKKQSEFQRQLSEARSEVALAREVISRFELIPSAHYKSLREQVTQYPKELPGTEGWKSRICSCCVYQRWLWKDDSDLQIYLKRIFLIQCPEEKLLIVST